MEASDSATEAMAVMEATEDITEVIILAVMATVTASIPVMDWAMAEDICGSWGRL